MGKRLSIAFVSVENPLDKRTWSGIPFHMVNSLQKFCTDVDVYYWKKTSLHKLIIRLISSSSRIIMKKDFDYTKSTFFSKLTCSYIYKQLFPKHHDVIICNGSFPIAYLEVNIPIVIFADSAFGLLIEYYDNRNYNRFLVKSGRQIEDRGFSKACLIAFSSDWARDFSKRNYSYSDKMVCIPFGANIETIPELDDIALRIKNRDICHLLFLGVDWKRKGGNIVLETYHILKKRGMNVDLTICGCNPPVFKEDITIMPFLNKNNEQDLKVFRELMIKSHFMFVPSRSEAYGLVFAEASAYGMPIISTDTGGISAVVKNGQNGFLLSLECGPYDYANLIEKIFLDLEGYKKLSFDARKSFEKVFNWDVAIKTLLNLIEHKCFG